MSRRISTTSRWRNATRLLGAVQGATAVEFAVIAPVLVLLTFGVIDIAMVMFQYHNLNEAARRAAREALLNPVGDATQLTNTGDTLTCSGATSSCTDGVFEATNFNVVLTAAQTSYPELAANQLTVSYANTGLGSAGCLVIPVITTTITGVRLDFLFLGGFIDQQGIELPDFAATRIGAITSLNPCPS